MPDHHHKEIKKQRNNDKGKYFSYPNTPNETSNMSKPPVFSMEYIQNSHCIRHCNDEDKLAFVDTIRELSHMTWQRIRNTDRHTTGSEKINRDSLHVEIPSWITDDITFIAIRFSGLKPMVGYQDGRIFQILWFDRDFSLYDHGD
jgi:hypothetical protein